MYKVEVSIKEKVFRIVNSLLIRQQFNNHHSFECSFYGDLEEKVSDYKIDRFKNWLGETINISLSQKEDSLKFKGVICSLKYMPNEGIGGTIIIKGYSPTILLETEGGHYESYSSIPLDSLMNQLKTDSKMGLAWAWAINPKNRIIKYITQYNESHFSFINRLSATYGDFFFYDGEKINFGKPTIIERVDLHSSDLIELTQGIYAKPVNFNAVNYDYLHPETAPASPSNIFNLPNNLANYALQTSSKTFGAFNRSYVESDTDEFEGLNKERRKALASTLVDISGKSNNLKLGIGSHATIYSKVGSQMGQFLITEITHQYNNADGYVNSFAGVLADVEALNVNDVNYPVAEPQVAHVMNTIDPENMGRVQVQMIWQKDKDNNTEWIRCLQQEAGNENRGFLFVPKKGDEVLVGFVYGDPDRPFVMGSVFNNFPGITVDPTVRIIRYGESMIRIRHDDTMQSILLESGNTSIHLDAKAGVIDITAPNLNFTCGELSIEALKSFELKAADMNIDAGILDIKASKSYKLDVGGQYYLNARSILQTSMNNINVTANNNINHTALTGDAQYSAQSGNLVINAAQNIRHVAGNKFLNTPIKSEDI